MFPLCYKHVYKTPAFHQPPEDHELCADTSYPNLNSRDFVKRPLNRTLHMHEFWECICLNEEAPAILATNKMNGREWNSSLWGFENIDEFAPIAEKEAGEPSITTATVVDLVPEQSCFKLQSNSLTTQMEYMCQNIFILAQRNGKVQVWSTRSDVRNIKNPYCLFLIGEKVEHTKPIMAMSASKCNSNKAITGCKAGTIKIWDMGCADLYSTNAYRYAHRHFITGLDTSPKDSSIFVSCSLDKSALIWDDRQTRPAKALYEFHSTRFKAISWSVCHEEETDNLIYLGDECGYLHTVDQRIPNKFLQSTQYFDRPIKKIVPNGTNIAVITDSNIVHIAHAKNHEIFYENKESEGFIRDAVWRNSNRLLTVGYEGKMRVHDI